MLAIETTGLTKDYHVGFWRRKSCRALDRLSLQVEVGEVFGLLGPNGAGKTTTLKILMGLAFPTGGTARLLERDPRDVSIHRKIGYLPENPSFYDHLTAQEFLTYAASLFGMNGREAARRTSPLIEAAGIPGGLPLRKFSKGMIQRLGIAQAVVNDPEIVFLDEPMSGLDPVGRREVRNLILELKGERKTIFFSTHILSDAETLCDRVAILDRGRLQGCGELREILEVEPSNAEVVLEKPGDDVLRALETYVSSKVRTGNRVRLVLRAEADLTEVLARIARLNAKLISWNPARLSLEDYFMDRVQNKHRLSIGENPAGPASTPGE